MKSAWKDTLVDYSHDDELLAVVEQDTDRMAPDNWWYVETATPIQMPSGSISERFLFTENYQTEIKVYPVKKNNHGTYEADGDPVFLDTEPEAVPEVIAGWAGESYDN